MELAFAILQGAGLAAACGIRPFLPALLAGALAGADLGVDFDGTHYAFLEGTAFLFAVFLALAAVSILSRRASTGQFGAGPLGAAVAGLGIGLGAVLFAGSLDDVGEPAWPGLVGGLACAALAHAAAHRVFSGAAGRLDEGARAALPLYADGASLLLAGLAVLAPPVSALALGFMLWLLVARRRREGEKYAGLRVLR
jgi:hypothetical protein